jgi:hypothetical protein
MRYKGLSIIQPGEFNERAELEPRVLVDGEVIERQGRAMDYTVVQGDRIDVLAYEYLGDSRLWYIIADMNPTVDPLHLVGGTILRLPRS